MSLDGALDEAREPSTKSHLAKCPACRRFADDLRRCSTALERLTVPDVRPGFTARMMARIPECKTARTGWKGWLDGPRTLRAGLGVLALCCGVVLAMLMNGESRPADSKRTKSAQSLYAGCFDPLPEDSVGKRFVSLLRQGGE